MATETKQKKAPKTKLDLVHDTEKLVKTVQQECAVRSYDQRKVMERFNCHGHQARTLITLAQIADAQGSTKSAKA
jgi:hypothetical protein